jgi:hypothetical protein
MLCDPLLIISNTCGELSELTPTDPKFREEGLSITLEFAWTFAPHRLPRITNATGNTNAHDVLLLDFIDFSWLTSPGRVGGPAGAVVVVINLSALAK